MINLTICRRLSLLRKTGCKSYTVVGREVQKLALVIEAGRDKIAEIEADRSEKEAATKKNLEALKAEYEQKSTELQTEYDTTTKN